MRKFISLLVMAALMLGIVGTVSAQNDDPIRVGSKQFTEQIVLGQIILVALEEAGYTVEDRTNLGSTQVNRDALVNGEIDIYAEYTGTALYNYFNDVAWADVPNEAYGDRALGYALVSSYDAAAYDLIWLEPAPANNTYAFAVTRAFAEENDIFSALDLADYVNAGGEVYIATGDEFALRPDGIPAFEVMYGFNLTEDQMLIIAGGTPAQTEQALHEGANNVNMAMAYATDGALQAYDFIVLEDPFGAQPIYAPTPVFRGDVLRANPEIAGILNPIFRALDNVNLQTLNASVEVDGENPRDVAVAWLLENGFIEG